MKTITIEISNLIKHHLDVAPPLEDGSDSLEAKARQVLHEWACDREYEHGVEGDRLADLASEEEDDSTAPSMGRATTAE